MTHPTQTERAEIGVVQRNHHVSACWDKDSLWVEISGPKGGNAWQMTPEIARALAGLLTAAADKAMGADQHFESLTVEVAAA